MRSPPGLVCTSVKGEGFGLPIAIAAGCEDGCGHCMKCQDGFRKQIIEEKRTWFNLEQFYENSTFPFARG